MSLTGRTPIDFISALRMSKALSLMKNNFGNVSEVALEVGYNNPSYFSKCFQKNYGCTPSEFIKNHGAH
jgi:AraC-like DNA-binding protein